MTTPSLEAIHRASIFRRLSDEDRARLATVAQVREFAKGDYLFSEGDPSDFFFVMITGRVKISKTTARGSDVILELFGPGDPVGAVAVYESRPFPASGIAIEPTTCVLIPRPAFFALLEAHPTLVRGLLIGLTHRLVELTNRLTELSGGRIEARLARLFLKLTDEAGQARGEGVFVPMPLSRQELADMTGTTIETTIRIMSRWSKQDIVRTEKDGFLVRSREALEEASLS